MLLGLEAAQGRPLDRDVEDLITAFGNGFLVLLAIWLVTNDLESLGAALLRHSAELQGSPPRLPPPEDLLLLVAALRPLLPLW